MRCELLKILRCPGCKSSLSLDTKESQATEVLSTHHNDSGSEDILSGTLVCTGCGKYAPIHKGIPRLLESDKISSSAVDEHTRSSFSLEWALHRPEEGTWGMGLDERIKWYFLNGVGLERHEVLGLRVLDAGCGNGSSTLGIARLGALCIGIDQSSGIDKASEYFTEKDKELDVTYVQANLLDALFAPDTFDVVFSAGVLHHLPSTKQGFMALTPLVKPGGRFYVWLYRHEKFVTPLVNTIRIFTTHLPPKVFFLLAVVFSPAFQLFTYVMRKTGLREYGPMKWRSSALALMDIFGARYAHAHTFEEVSVWYEEAGFEPPSLRSLERRGFSACGIKKLMPNK